VKWRPAQNGQERPVNRIEIVVAPIKRSEYRKSGGIER
jgi:hypothetical protein